MSSKNTPGTLGLLLLFNFGSRSVAGFGSCFFFFFLRGKELQSKVFYSLYQQSSEVNTTENGDLGPNAADHFVQRSKGQSRWPCDLRGVAYPLFKVSVFS